MDSFGIFIPILVTLPVVAGILWGANWILLKKNVNLGNEQKFPRQLIMLALSVAGLIAIAMALPVGVSTRNQVIAFMGLVVSGIFAFSSTTVFANLMAGLMLRITRPFRAGDFVRVEEHFGRVSERGLLDTEIQTETSQLIAIHNTYLITHPVSVIRSSGTIISVSLSLGYDVYHAVVTPLLVEAARESGLAEPFVHITSLGDFSVTYKVNGLLVDVKSLITARSLLNQHVLDALHREGIEIVSPGFMNQRPLAPGQKFIPQQVCVQQEEQNASVEQIAFDKAEEAEKREMEQNRLTEEIARLESGLDQLEESQRKAMLERIDNLKLQLRKLDQQEPEPS